MESGPSKNTSSLDAALVAWSQEFAPHGIVATDSDLKICIWNRWMTQHSGLSLEQVLGRSVLELFQEVGSARLEERFRGALLGEASVLSSALHRYLFPFASTVPTSTFKHMRQTAWIGPLVMNGKICGTITTIQDVTEREFQSAQARQQQHREQLLSWAAEHLLRASEPESFLHELFRKTGEHLEVELFFNFLVEPGAEQMRLHSSGGLTAAQEKEIAFLDVGQALYGRSAQERKPVVVQNLQECNDPGANLLKQLGARCYVAQPLIVGDQLVGTLSFASIRRNQFSQQEIDFLAKIAQYVAVAVDRTRKEKALMNARLQLEEHASNLEKKVEERTAKLTETVSDLEGFCYTISHDLRAPIRHIGSYVQALREEASADLAASAMDFLNRIEGSARRMDILTRDLLRYSKISREQIRMEPVDLRSLVQDIIDHTPALRAPGTVSLPKDLQTVLAHRTLLQQCLSNLLENAIKFVPAGVQPRIVIRTEIRSAAGLVSAESDTSLIFNRSGHMPPALAEDHSWHHQNGDPAKRPHLPSVRIWIEDNGIGIKPEFAMKIFGIFERACDPCTFEGTGIGLAIVAKGMQRMGGSSGVESELGKGSRFWLDLPLP